MVFAKKIELLYEVLLCIHLKTKHGCDDLKKKEKNSVNYDQLIERPSLI